MFGRKCLIHLYKGFSWRSGNTTRAPSCHQLKSLSDSSESENVGVTSPQVTLSTSRSNLPLSISLYTRHD